jgi:hypothetical protein
MTDMHYEDVSYGGMNFRLGVPKKNMVEYPATREGKAFVAIEGKEIIPGSKTPYRETGNSWEILFATLGISAYTHHGKKDNYHEVRFSMLGVTKEFLGFSGFSIKHPALAIEKAEKKRLHPLERAYRAEVAEQKEADELANLKDRLYTLQRKARSAGIMLPAVRPPKTKKQYQSDVDVLEKVLKGEQVFGQTPKSKEIPDTGRMTCSDRKPALQHLPYPKKLTEVPKKLTEVKDAAGQWLRVGDFAVFVHPDSSNQTFKITGFDKFENSDKIGIELAGRRLLYDPTDMVRARMADESIGTVSGVTWVDKDQKERYLQPGMLVTCPSYPTLKMRVTSVEGGLNGDEGKGPKRVPTVCVIIFRGNKYVSGVRLSINDVTPLPVA